MNLAIEYQRVQSKKFDFRLRYEVGAGEGGEVPVRIYLEPMASDELHLGLGDIVMVQYQLDPSFRSRTVSSKDSGRRFELRLRAHGSFELTAIVLLMAGRTETIRGFIDISKATGEVRMAL